MTLWVVANLALLSAGLGIGWVARRHLFRAPADSRRRREAALIGVVSVMSLAGFGLAHLQLNHAWGVEEVRFTSWSWLMYATAFSLALVIAHLCFRRFNPTADQVILPIVAVAMLVGLLNVWVWETKDANAFVSSVALPQIREFEALVTVGEGLEEADRTVLLARLGEVPNELSFDDGPASVLNPAWVAEFNSARQRYLSVVEQAPAVRTAELLAPVVVDNVFHRQLLTTLVAILMIPFVATMVARWSQRPWASSAALWCGSLALMAGAILGLGQGTSGSLPAFLLVGGTGVTVFAPVALLIVVVLAMAMGPMKRGSKSWRFAAVAVAAAVIAMTLVDTGAGLLLALVVVATVTAVLRPSTRRLVFAGMAALLVFGATAAITGHLPGIPDRAKDRLVAWVDPWNTHSDAEVVNAAVRSVQQISSVADNTDVTPVDATALIEQELAWRLDAMDGEITTGSPVIPRNGMEELVLYEAELLWSDLGGYEADTTPAAQETMSSRVSLATSVLSTSAARSAADELGLSGWRAAPRADGLQLQRSLHGLTAGGLFGVGVGGGRSEAIPEVTEDVALAFVGESFGFVGIVGIVGLVLLIASRTGRAARSLTGNRAGILSGLGLLLAVQAIVNFGGVTGALPFTGLPFPFISRTGTGALITGVTIGIITALATGAVTSAPAPSARQEVPKWPRIGPLSITGAILIINLAAIQLFGRLLVPGPVAGYIPEDGDMLLASNAWELADYRTRSGRIIDRNGLVLAQSSAYGIRTYPDAELALSLSHTLFRLEQNIPRVNGTGGPDMVTTIDGDVQRAVHHAIEAGSRDAGFGDASDLRGAVVLVDVVTGAIVAIESRPTFSPLELVDAQAWAEAEGLERRAGFYHRHLNRAVDGSYPPGSVGKVITAAAILDDELHVVGSEDFDFRSGPMGPRLPDDTKHHTIWHQIEFADGETISDGHLGHIDEWVFDIEEAFAHSSNVSFSLMAIELGSERLATATRAFGYDVDHEVPFYGEFSATIGEADSEGTFYVEKGDSQVAQTGLGQGESLTSPLHLALVSAAIANDGTAMSPHVVTELVHRDGEREVVGVPAALFDTGLEPGTIVDLQNMMAAAVDYGTAGNATTPGSNPASRPAGKTGSAQWSDDLDRTHSLFTGFYPRTEPRLAIAVVVERGGTGGGIASHIVREVFESDAVAAYLASVSLAEGTS